MSENPESARRRQWSTDEWRELCHVKRFMERWHGDREFRQGLHSDPAACVRPHGLEVDAEQLRPLWDLDILCKLHAGEIDPGELPRPVRNYRVRMAESADSGSIAPREPRWRAWRQRQMARAQSELGEVWSKPLIFATGCYELSKGCSVGCWFCGVSAPRLSDHFRYCRDNARLFRGVLEVMLGICGPQAVRAQGLFWATDPLDNPDYEAYSRDFRDVVGKHPLITTALALRDVERTRALLRLIAEDGGSLRFSIFGKKHLDRLHRAFSPAELGHVKCVIQSDESVLLKSNSGRFRDRALGSPELLQRELDKVSTARDKLGGGGEDLDTYLGPSTIACVAGFLFNLVDRQVQLISPCRASDRWPLGYVVHSEGTFRDPGDLETLLEDMIDGHMPRQLPRHQPVRFRSDLEYQRSASGIKLWTVSGGHQFGQRAMAAYWGDLGDLVHAGRSTPEAIASRLLGQHGVFPGETLRNLHEMFEKGLLCEQPEVSPEQPTSRRSGGPDR